MEVVELEAAMRSDFSGLRSACEAELSDFGALPDFRCAYGGEPNDFGALAKPRGAFSDRCWISEDFIAKKKLLNN